MYPSIKLPFSSPRAVLAVGSELKSRFAILSGNRAYMSALFEDLRDPRAFELFKRAIADKKKDLKIEPEIIACDLHPDYLSSRYAKEMCEKSRKSGGKTRLVRIQHHHAHVAACMAECGLRGRVIGVAFDGTGYGRDGKIWGGEFLTADYLTFERAGHLEYVPMPGGDKAVTEPARMAFSYLCRTYKKDIGRLKTGVLKRIGKKKISLLTDMIAKDINSPLTSSAGRLFDAVSSLIGIRDTVSCEGEAAIELERAARAERSGAYPFDTTLTPGGIVVSFSPMIRAIISDLRNKKPAGAISRKFHHTLAGAIGDVCVSVRKRSGIKKVVMTGGVFQNRLLAKETEKRLTSAKFSVYKQAGASCADRGLCLGQAAIAAAQGGKKCA